jgi:hypothetical protein
MFRAQQWSVSLLDCFTILSATKKTMFSIYLEIIKLPCVSHPKVSFQSWSGTSPGFLIACHNHNNKQIQA